MNEATQRRREATGPREENQDRERVESLSELRAIRAELESMAERTTDPAVRERLLTARRTVALGIEDLVGETPRE